jgi:hypothetical protein
MDNYLIGQANLEEIAETLTKSFFPSVDHGKPCLINVAIDKGSMEKTFKNLISNPTTPSKEPNEFYNTEIDILKENPKALWHRIFFSPPQNQNVYFYERIPKERPSNFFAKFQTAHQYRLCPYGHAKEADGTTLDIGYVSGTNSSRIATLLQRISDPRTIVVNPFREDEHLRRIVSNIPKTARFPFVIH